MSEQRSHPDLFTPEEAAAYLRIRATTLDLCRERGYLGEPFKIGKKHRMFCKEVIA